LQQKGGELMANHISQREARRLRQELNDLKRANEARFASWSRAYPGGTHIDTIILNDVEAAIVKTATALGHVIIAKGDGKSLNLFAVRS
jgi:hypothetical protein